MALAVKRNGSRQRLDEHRSLGPWADEAHLSHQHVYQLRQLINSQAADNGADPRDAWIVRRRPAGLAGGLGFDLHAAELEEREAPAVLSDAHLPIKNWAAIFEIDSERGEEPDRQHDH